MSICKQWVFCKFTSTFRAENFYNLNDGDEVITSAVNFPTTVNPIMQNNLKPVFVDADKSSFNIDNLIEKITEKN